MKERHYTCDAEGNCVKVKTIDCKCPRGAKKVSQCDCEHDDDDRDDDRDDD